MMHIRITTDKGSSWEAQWFACMASAHLYFMGEAFPMVGTGKLEIVTKVELIKGGVDEQDALIKECIA